VAISGFHDSTSSFLNPFQRIELENPAAFIKIRQISKRFYRRVEEKLITFNENLKKTQVQNLQI
jgi:hypothetical protein